MKVMLDSFGIAPERAHATDAGLDLKAKMNVIVPAHGSALVGTGTHVELPFGTAGLLVSKSGLNCKHDITSTGLIDVGFTGEIMVKLYNHGSNDYIVKRGDKVSQLVVFPVLYVDAEIVDHLSGGSERGDNGFGSTGK